MLRAKLQAYLDCAHAGATINTPHSIHGSVNIRYELGDDLKNGTRERVIQATERAYTIFTDLFPEPASSIFVLIYDYGNDGLFGGNPDYLYQQFPEVNLREFHSKVESINTRFFISDRDGNDVPEKADIKIVIGELKQKDIQVKNILNAIANTEMGFEPGINQEIYFIDTTTDCIFYMYDDRGCYAMSNKPDKLHELYIKRNEWIVAFYKAQIDRYFIK